MIAKLGLAILSVAWFVAILVVSNRNAVQVEAAAAKKAGLGVDVDFYTGPISRDVWLRMKKAGVQFVIAQAWGGRSRNEFAISQLAGARSIGMREAAYILLNYDDKVCSSFDSPVRDKGGRCAGDLIRQTEPGARFQVKQGLGALGAELTHVAFIAIDVEWFLSALPPADPMALAARRQYILDAIDEVHRRQKRTVIYTRNVQGHWFHITGCDDDRSSQSGCKALSKAINDPVRPIPLWDVQTGSAELANFRPYAEWTERAGRQYMLDKNLFGLPEHRTVDLNVFDLSLFSPAKKRRSL